MKAPLRTLIVSFRLLPLTCAAIFLLGNANFSAAKEIADSSTAFSIITCSPGPDLYSLFGHSAIRYRDTLQGRPVDWVYNYGTFIFDEDFYWKFCTGKLDYMLSKSSFENFLQEYDATGRGVVEQPLKLTAGDEFQLLALLEENYRPENRFYRYDFFYDNCSTRIRDILQTALGGQLNYSYRGPGGITYRQAIQQYLDYMPWADFGIDLALGLPCDKEMGVGGDMFLPDSLFKEMDFALNAGIELVEGEREILPQHFHLTSRGWLSPINLFSLFLVLQVVLGLRWLKLGKPWIFPDRMLFFLSGLIGIFVVFLWFFTDHTATVWNFNLLWANPLNVIFAFGSGRKSWQMAYLLGYGWILFALCMTWFLLPQQLNMACIPIVLGLLFVCVKKLRPRMLVAMTQ